MALGLASCADTDEKEKDISVTWEDGLSDWMVGYADYPAGLSLDDSLNLYAMSYGIRDLPAEIQPARKSLLTAASNRSDDLFMYVFTRIEGLRPTHEYSVEISYELASNAPTNAVGVGGAPGESVFLKAGASDKKPESKIEDGWYRMNIDKGNQSVAGENMVNTGNAGVADDTNQYTLISRSTPAPVTARSDANGDLWIILGSDSGYEGYTALYYTRCSIKAVPR